MTMRHFCFLITLCAFIGALACQTTASESAKSGPYLEAVGTAWAPKSNPRGLARQRVIADAEEDARAKIRQQFASVEVKPGTTILQAMEGDPYIWSRIMGILKATKAHQQTIDNEGKATVQMRISLPEIREIALYGEEAD